MRKMVFKNLVIIAIFGTSLLPLSGCGNSTENTESSDTEDVIAESIVRDDNPENKQILKVTTESGDVIEITINNKKTNIITYDEESGTMYIESENGTELGRCSFLTAKFYKEYYDSTAADSKLVTRAQDANVLYMLRTVANSSDIDSYEILGWITGSNTAVVYESSQDEEEMMDVFTDLWFYPEITDMDDEYYAVFPNEIDEEE